LFTIFSHTNIFNIDNNEKKFIQGCESDEMRKDFSKISKYKLKFEGLFVAKCSVKIIDLIDPTSHTIKAPWNLVNNWDVIYNFTEEEIKISMANPAPFVWELQVLNGYTTDTLANINKYRRCIFKNNRWIILCAQIASGNPSLERIEVTIPGNKYKYEQKEFNPANDSDLNRFADSFYFNNVTFRISPKEIWAEIDGTVQCVKRHRLFVYCENKN
jgi:hypothetical protein